MLDADQEQLARVVALVRDVLGPNAVGAYLFGSAVLGGLQPRSDLDVLAVSKRRTTREERQGLVDRLLAISGRSTPQGRWRNVELTIVVESEIKPWRFPPRRDFQYGQRFRAAFESGNLSPWPTTTDPDLAALITMVLLADSPVLGPPPNEIFDPVPQHDLIRAIIGDIDAWLDNLDSDTRNVILALARIWGTVATGVIRSKDAAADWALDRLAEEHRTVLARARAIYLGEEEGPVGRHQGTSSTLCRSRSRRDSAARQRQPGTLSGVTHAGVEAAEVESAQGSYRGNGQPISGGRPNGPWPRALALTGDMPTKNTLASRRSEQIRHGARTRPCETAVWLTPSREHFVEDSNRKRIDLDVLAVDLDPWRALPSPE
jgi:predicted nucleotidyltransferase